MPDWVAWHRSYDEPGSPLHRRLLIVQTLVAEALDGLPPGEIRVVSMCAGQGRDLIGAVAGHPRRDDVVARLVELDPHNADTARRAVGDAGLPGIEVVEGDAARSDAYAGAVPAEIVLACGVFGNIADEDVAFTVGQLPQLCAPGGTVIWTRHRRPPDLTPVIRTWFRDAGFDEATFVAPPDVAFSVGVHRLRVAPPPLAPGVRLFRFLGSGGQGEGDAAPVSPPGG